MTLTSLFDITKNGKFSVKSGYWLATLDIPTRSTPSTSYTVPHHLWRKIWKANTAPRVRHFFWKAITNSLATKENLFKRKCGASPLCPNCEHTLLQCSWTKPVWFGSPLCARIDPRAISTLAAWTEATLEKSSTAHNLELIMNICWQIWRARNNWVFSETKLKPELVIHQALWIHKDFVKECYTSNISENNLEGLGRRSKSGYLKISIDASYKENSVWSGGGIIVRSESVKLVDMWSGLFKMENPLVTEALASRVACQKAKENQWVNVEFESDPTLIRSCNEENVPPSWDIDTIVTDIKMLANTTSIGFSLGVAAR